MAATGSQSDLIARLQAWLPSRWFPTQAQNSDGSVPRIYAMISGAAAILAQVWNQLQYARAQTRLGTSTDGWLDLGVYDYAGSRLPRNSGESDSAYWARVQPQLLPSANTRPNIQNALETLTGQDVRMIEPWDPRDTGVWDGPFTYYDADSEETPSRFTNSGDRYQGFIECCLPTVAGQGAAPSDATFDGIAYYDVQAWYWDAPSAPEGGATLVYSLINRLKVFGTTIWVQFLPTPGSGNPFVLGTSELGGPDILT